MFILASLIGGMFGYLYGKIFLNFFLSEDGRAGSHLEDSSIFYLVGLPTAITSPIIVEFSLDEILGSKILMGGHTGFWRFLENLPELAFYLVLLLIGMASIFVAILYVFIPIILLLGIFLKICDHFLNNGYISRFSKKIMLTSYQTNVVILFLIFLGIYAALKFYLCA